MGRYTIHLVGESNFQAAIRGIQAGSPVKLTPEPDNPHDGRAIKAVVNGTDTIGYVERDSWLTRAMLDDGTSVASRVHEVIGGEVGKPSLGVVLEVLTAAEADAALARKAVPITASVAGVEKEKRGCGFYALVAVGILIGLAVLGSILGPPKPNSALAPNVAPVPDQNKDYPASDVVVANDPGISALEFAQLRNGMTYDEAQAVVGSSGELVTDSEIAGIRTFAVKWDGERGFGANANVMFQNGKLVMKAQAGLQ